MGVPSRAGAKVEASTRREVRRVWVRLEGQRQRRLPRVRKGGHEHAMNRRSRIRRIAKWSGVAVSVILLAAWGLALFRFTGYVGGRSGVVLVSGAVVVTWARVPSTPFWVNMASPDFGYWWLPTVKRTSQGKHCYPALDSPRRHRPPHRIPLLPRPLPATRPLPGVRVQLEGECVGGVS